MPEGVSQEQESLWWVRLRNGSVRHGISVYQRGRKTATTFCGYNRKRVASDNPTSAERPLCENCAEGMKRALPILEAAGV